MSEIAKKENTELKATDPVTFGITPISKSKINPQAVALVNEFLPELDEKTKFFDRNNSQSTLSMMSLTMLNGHSPHRICLLYTSPSPRDRTRSRMPSSA